MTNVAAWLLASARPEDPAVWDAGRWYTYAELIARTCSVAVRVRANDAAGTIVPLYGENSFDLVAAYLGVLHAGAIPAPLAPLDDEALLAVLQQTSARMTIAAATHAPRLRALGATVLELEHAGDAAACPPTPIADRHALAVLLYTSGSTGVPRGVMLSPRNLQFSADEILRFAPLEATDRGLLTLPLYYCYGLSVLHTHLRVGAAVVLARLALPEEVLDIADATNVTGIPGVPSLFQLLVSRSTLAKRALPQLRYAMLSGAKAPERLVADLQNALPGVRIYLRYGITEATAAVSCLPPERLADKRGSIGRGLAGSPLAVERPDGTPVAAGSDEEGEVIVRGDHVALGYFADPDETARYFQAAAFRSGDRARVDADGYVFLVGRDKELVKTAGHRVAPQEVEHVIGRLPAVFEVAVVGMPHPIRGEALVAVIVVRPGHALEPAAVRTHCEATLAPWKIPTSFHVVAALPKLESGKLDRRALRASLGG